MTNDLRASLEDKFRPSNWTGFNAFKHYKYSGLNLIDEVNALDPDLVLDIGCGHNRFKGHIKNLIGFDQEPFPYADLQMPIEQANFRKESVDVAMALGSIQFGSRELVEMQMDRVVSWVKPGGFIVMRVMQDHFGKTPYPHQDAHYIWTEKDLSELTAKYDFEITKGPFLEEVLNKEGIVTSTRLVWWWKKPGDLKKYSIDPITCKIEER